MKTLNKFNSLIYYTPIKLHLLLFSVVIFGFLYLLLPDENFSGVNIVKETIKQEIIKKKVSKNIEEKEIDGFEFFTPNYQKKSFFNQQDINAELDKATLNVRDTVEKETITPESIDTSLQQKMFDRFYFSVQNATLLGYGDIYPVSNLSKIVVIFQSLLTIALILY